VSNEKSPFESAAAAPGKVHWTKSKVASLVQPIIEDDEVVTFEVVDGGLANLTLRVWLARRRGSIAVRIYERDPAAADRERALYLRLRKKVTMPRLLYTRDGNPLTGHPYAIWEWAQGRRLDEVAAAIADSPDLAGIGRAVGANLAAIHAVCYEHTGLLGPDLDLEQNLAIDGPHLIRYAQEHLQQGAAGARLGPRLAGSLQRFVAAESHRLDEPTGHPCLVHGDFGGSNLLIRERDSAWTVSAVLDWEFAFSGLPEVDLGTLLRGSLGRLDRFVAGLVEGYRGAGGTLGADWRRRSLLVDLFAWIHRLERREVSVEFVRDARRAVRRTIEQFSSTRPTSSP
jgi:aminoglycoside phosphotransferase (APT) family kinase protein